MLEKILQKMTKGYNGENKDITFQHHESSAYICQNCGHHESYHVDEEGICSCRQCCQMGGEPIVCEKFVPQ
ncbi:hypothetical protein Ngar_c34820 [Candidatus Nitrososphaera gargensis Ga9.2]|uniref:Uncharacterized protein n=1 Tax=Nitrososphaera gargensis (strain Ga9.2) TaxID=1237085 RepID=K0IG68_NITGG|nr:hypothetical protein Ngar_c34820 [Candidatus Nitrososphaera gargensis Ga9.2]